MKTTTQIQMRKTMKKNSQLKNEWFEFVRSYVNEDGMLDDTPYHLDALEHNFRSPFLREATVI